ncbi:MAG: hypothetical protein H0V75_11680 [Rubrobacter sp.]|jgi:hypothetical protein|nr:hypothetical protein [Rubrobacter sp.]
MATGRTGPGIRIVAHERNELLSLVLEVASLERARSFLDKRGMTSDVSEDEIGISPNFVGCLNIRLSE